MCVCAHVHICVLCGLVCTYVSLTYVDTAGALLQSPGWGSQASPMVVLVMKSAFLGMVLLRDQVGWTDSRVECSWNMER